MADGFLDPASGQLRNTWGLADEHQLEQAEATYAQLRIMELLANPPALRLDAAGLQAIHRHLFQDVYSWAGELRG